MWGRAKRRWQKFEDAWRQTTLKNDRPFHNSVPKQRFYKGNVFFFNFSISTTQITVTAISTFKPSRYKYVEALNNISWSCAERVAYSCFRYCLWSLLEKISEQRLFAECCQIQLCFVSRLISSPKHTFWKHLRYPCNEENECTLSGHFATHTLAFLLDERDVGNHRYVFTLLKIIGQRWAWENARQPSSNIDNVVF